MASIEEFHPELSIDTRFDFSDGTHFVCDFQGAQLVLYKPHNDVLSSEVERVPEMNDGSVETLYRPNEEAACGGVNMAELVLDKLIEYRDRRRPIPFDIYGNHPPSKGAERTALYKARKVHFDIPIHEISAGNAYLFSAHGADPSEVERARKQGLYVVDTTCPLVDRIYSHVRKAAKNGQDGIDSSKPESTAVVYLAPLYSREHPEVAGARGVVETAGFRFIPVRNEDEGLRLLKGDEAVGPEEMNLEGIDRLLVTGLTTSNAEEILGIGRKIAEEADGRYTTIPYSERDVCRTVQFRQEAIGEVVGKNLVDEVVILGAVESNNTNELVRKTLSTLSKVTETDRRLRRITFGNHFSQIPLDIRGDVLLMSGASTQIRNVDQATTFLNPRTIIRVGRQEKLDLFRPLGRGSLAERILKDDFDWVV